MVNNQRFHRMGKHEHTPVPLSQISYSRKTGNERLEIGGVKEVSSWRVGSLDRVRMHPCHPSAEFLNDPSATGEY